MLGFQAVISYFFLTIILSVFVRQTSGQNRPRVAIIGGGIGGTVAAYELTKLAVEHNINIDMDLYESGEVGGRLATTFVNGHEFETGGSIIHIDNEYMSFYVKKFNISKLHESKDTNVFGFYDGEKFVFVQSQNDLWTYLKFWWRYGWDLLNLDRHIIDPFLYKFKRVYEQQASKRTFNDVQSFLAVLNPDFPSLLDETLDHFLITRAFTRRFIDEFVFLATNVNYNQDTNIHAFVGAVGLAGTQGTLWSVEGGNKRVPQALLAHSDAKLIKKRVQSVFLTPDSKFALQVDNNHSHIYDYVIVACPIIKGSKSNIEFNGFPEKIRPQIKYQRTIVTMVHGDLNHTYFGYDSPEDLPKTIFSVKKDLFFNSINLLYPVVPDENYDKKVFKIFSKKHLTEDQLDSLFATRDIVTTKDWLAYPLYEIEKGVMSFYLHKNLIHTNVIEWAASAMEMSAVSGVNAALYVYKKISSNWNPNALREMPKTYRREGA